MKRNEYINAYCTGCGLCHSVIGTELKINERGFPNVAVEENDNYSFYEAVCPVYYYAQECEHDIWGKIEKAIVGYSSDKDIRFKAASGGALTELCIYMLENRFVDGIVHTTYDPSDQTKTVSCISTSEEEVRACCSSRYSISVPLERIFQIIESEKRYVFIGKPCDVMALRRYLSVNKELENVFPYLFSFFCAGEPSVNAQRSLLNNMGCELEECKSIRYRGNGWPGYTTVIKKDGSIVKMEYKDAWGKHLGRDLRNICRFCMDGTGDAADIVCADFWYLNDAGTPDFSEHDGRNIIISRTAKGTQIMMDAVASGRIICESEFTERMNEFHKYQPAQYKRKSTMKSMISAMKLCGRNTPKYSRSYLDRYAGHASYKAKLKYFFGIVKRVAKGKI